MYRRSAHGKTAPVGPSRPFPSGAFRRSPASTPASRGRADSPAKMFLVAGAKNAASVRGNERRWIYQKVRGVDLLDKKKTATALKPGEDRALLLGLGMILSSVMMYFVLGTTVLRSYAESAWTEEGVCVVLNSTVIADVNCSYDCGPDCRRASKYPCLQVYVSVNQTGRVSRLSRDEDTREASSECFYVPKCQKDSGQARGLVAAISRRLEARRRVPCFYEPGERRDEAVLLTRLYDRGVVFRWLMWPSGLFLGGALIIVLVKLTQYLSRLCEEIGKLRR
ncbi:calcium-activated potassium channel subunit beta-2-like isoform X2 [Stigmatopora nigra]